MTSEAGDRAPARPILLALVLGRVGRRASRGAGHRGGGFTIVEVLVVISIIAILFTLVMLAASNLRSKAYLESTRAMIKRLQTNLEEYRRLRGSYPPDGYDSEVKTKDGKPIWGSACLYEFLGKEFTVEENIAGQVRRSKHEPLMHFEEERELSAEDPESPEVREIRDGFGLPFHYDNTENERFEPDRQREAAHMEPVKDHPPDPRSDPEVVERRGIQRPGAYDLWSHGSQKGHEPEADLRSTVGSWNVDVEKPRTDAEKGR